jgi:hypothetical protein
VQIAHNANRYPVLIFRKSPAPINRPTMAPAQ